MGLMPKMGETRLNIFQQLTTKKPVCEGLDELLGYKKATATPTNLDGGGQNGVSTSI